MRFQAAAARGRVARCGKADVDPTTGGAAGETSGGDEGEDATGGSCQGGPGGKGGNGGHGGGGIGGPSVGIAFVGDEPSQSDVSIKVASIPAAGGLGGGGSETNAGQNGLVMKTQLFPSN